jgi:hypothetical protein
VEPADVDRPPTRGGDLVVRFGRHRVAPAVVAAAAPVLLFLALLLGPACEGCESIFDMAYLGVAAFILLPIVLLLVVVNRLRGTQWVLALLSLELSLLLTGATMLGSAG